ncbi:MAG: S8 family serine peptidase [Cyanobacteria bacterium SBLK]|nr:S8 family serine peptidase [Cyanobacteria bacterium SBLK]
MLLSLQLLQRLFVTPTKEKKSKKSKRDRFLQSFVLEEILTPSALVDTPNDPNDDIDIDSIIDSIDSADNTDDGMTEDAGGENSDVVAPPDVSSLQSSISADDYEVSPWIIEDTGVFTVGETGEVGIDFLFDGGKYQGEVAIFNLEGMDEFEPGSEEFIKEAARRALSDSEMGRVVIRDSAEGARFDGTLGEGKDWNSGTYQGVKTFQMEAGDRFAVMLVANDSVRNVYDDPSVGALFSLATANPDDNLHFGQIADVTGDGDTFVMEDVRHDHKWYDQDYNDLIFRVQGAEGEAPLMDELIDPDDDWRESDLGQKLVNYGDSDEPGDPDIADPPEEPEAPDEPIGELPDEPEPENPEQPENPGNPDDSLPVDPETGRQYNPEEVLVKFKADASKAEIENLAEALGATGVENLMDDGENTDAIGSQWKVLKFDSETNLLAVREALATEDTVADIELNYKIGVRGTNDPSFNRLWGLNNTGQTGGRFDADIDAPEAWQHQKGSKSVVVAVIDTGGDYRHQDLAANTWRNTREIAGNGIDDDRNGFVDDVYGYDFRNNDGDPMDDHGHGTHVAGTIGAVGNNNIGVVGVNHNVSLMHLKFLGANGSGSTLDAVRAVKYATQMGADVINASFGGGGYSKALADAILQAHNAGTVFVAAAGNNRSNNDTRPYYPTNYTAPNVISVAATDHNDRLASFSNYGRTTVDLGAPGVNILSTTPGNRYGYKSGTSMAAPHVAGAAALLLAENPNLTPTQIKDILMKTTDSVSDLQGKTVTGGRLNLNRALQSLGSGPSKSTINVSASDWYAQEKRWWESKNPASFRITRGGSNINKSETVYYSLSGTASNGSDYSRLSGAVTIPAGRTSVDIPINVIDDSRYEGTENVKLTLRSNSNYNIGSSSSSTAWIYDNDPRTTKSTMSLRVSDWYASERKWYQSKNPGQFTITRSGGNNSRSETVYYSVSGTATNGSDYSRLSGYVTIPAGQTSVNLPVNVIDDSRFENPETVTVTLRSNSNYNLSSSKAGSVWLYDNDPRPVKSTVSLYSHDTYANESGNNGSVRVIRSGGNISSAQRVYYSLSGTAGNGSDYSRLHGYIDIPAGQTTAYIPIRPINDSHFENTEQVKVTLRSSSSYNNGSSTSGYVNIYDNDHKSTINISNYDTVATESGNSGSVRVTRSGGDLRRSQRVYYSLSGTATNASDYSRLYGYVDIPAGQTTAYIPIRPINDSHYENTEQVKVTLRSSSSYNNGSSTSGYVNIYDNDPRPKPTISVYNSDTYASESGNNGSIRITRSGGSLSHAQRVYYSLSGTAGNGSDYSRLNTYVDIPAGQSTVYIPVRPINDSTYEGTEQVRLTLRSSSSYNNGSSTSGYVNIYDNDYKSTVSISNYDTVATESGNNGSVRVTRSGGNINSSQRVYYSLSGTATNASDYSRLYGYVDIPAGSTTAYIPIKPINDSHYESTEQVKVTLRANSGYNNGSSTSGYVNIYDNDPKPAQKVYVSSSAGRIWEIDKSTNIQRLVYQGTAFTDLATNSNGKLYGSTFSGLYEVNTATKSAKYLGSFGGASINALASSPSGQLFGADSNNGKLFRISSYNGQATYIGSLGSPSSGDLVFYNSSEILATVRGTYSDRLVSFNVNTGSLKNIGNLGFRNVYGLTLENGILTGYTASGQKITINRYTGSASVTGSVTHSGEIWGAAA